MVIQAKLLIVGEMERLYNPHNLLFVLVYLFLLITVNISLFSSVQIAASRTYFTLQSKPETALRYISLHVGAKTRCEG